MTRITRSTWPLFSLALTALVLLFGGLSSIRAAEGDGRINLAGYLGGDVIYCANGSSPTSEPNGAGLRLLNLNGDELFYVSPEQIAAVGEHPAVNTVIAQGNGSFGPVYLSRLTDGRFQLSGQDDHGKSYVFEWSGCTQVTPIPQSGDDDSQRPGDRFNIDSYCDPYDGIDKQDCLDYWVPALEAECKDQGYNTSESCLEYINRPR